MRHFENASTNLAAAPFASEAIAVTIKLQTIASVSEVVDESLALLDRFGIKTMLFGGVPGVRQGFADTILAKRGAEEWLCEYARKEYFRVDPVIPAIRRSTRPFLWSEILVDATQSPDEAAIMRRRREYGFNQGFVVPIHNPAGPPHFVTMKGADLELTPVARQLIPLVVRCAFERIQDIGHAKVLRRSLSARECEILSWVARGESAAQIGAALDIAESTVETHIRHVCLKLGASNRAHAVAIGLSDRHIQI